MRPCLLWRRSQGSMWLTPRQIRMGLQPSYLSLKSKTERRNPTWLQLLKWLGCVCVRENPSVSLWKGKELFQSFCCQEMWAALIWQFRDRTSPHSVLGPFSKQQSSSAAICEQQLWERCRASCPGTGTLGLQILDDPLVIKDLVVVDNLANMYTHTHTHIKKSTPPENVTIRAVYIQYYFS